MFETLRQIETVDSSFLMLCLSLVLNMGARLLFSQFTEDFSNFMQFLKILKRGAFRWRFTLLLPTLHTILQKYPPEVFCKKKVFLAILQNSQKNSCARVSFLIKLQT